MAHDLRYRLTRLVPILLLAVVSACIPVPKSHTVTLQPDMQGVIMLDGIPLRQTGVVLAGLDCGEAAARTVTDASGRFVFERIDEDRSFYPLPLVPVHKLYMVTVCVEHDGALHPIYRRSDYTLYEKGLGPLPDVYRLECPLTASQLSGQVEEGPSLCTARTEGGWRQGDGQGR